MIVSLGPRFISAEIFEEGEMATEFGEENEMTLKKLKVNRKLFHFFKCLPNRT